MGKKSSTKAIVKDVLIVAIGVITIWFGLQIVFGTANPFYVVSSGSMIPELEVFDVLVVQGNDPFESVQVGDIIVFNRPSGHDRVIVHRVVAIIDENPLTIRTKGDANPASIPGTDYPITEEEYIGQVEYVIPQVGYVTRILTPPINYIIIGIIVVVMIVKQFTKTKKQSELSDSFSFDSPEEKKDDFEMNKEELDKLPKDSEYTEKTEEKEFLDYSKFQDPDLEKNNSEKNKDEEKKSDDKKSDDKNS